MSELACFVGGVLADLDGAGALADWLDEHDDPRGPLLRKRWKRWRTERGLAGAGDRAAEEAAAKPWREFLALVESLDGSGSVRVKINGGGEHKADESFRRYIRERFGAGEEQKGVES